MKPRSLSGMMSALLVGGTLISFGVSSIAEAAPAKKVSHLTRVYSMAEMPSGTKTTTSGKAKAATPRALTPVATVAMSSKEVVRKHAQAIDVALKGDTKTAIAILAALSTKAPGGDELDRIHLSLGRIHYQAGNNTEALAAYQRVRSGSISWLESLEERAWTNMRMSRPEEAMSSLKTVLSPVFQEKINSEPYFLMSLAQLRVCDFTSMFKTIDAFKNRFRGKIRTWEETSDLTAKARLRETSETIQKVNLVEAEAIQRIYMDESGRRQAGKVPKIHRDRNQLSFPEVPGDEVWLDEVDNYRVAVKGCPQPTSSVIAKKESSL